MKPTRRQQMTRDATLPEVAATCGVGEMFGDGTPALQLPTKRPMVLIQDALPSASKDVIWDWYRAAAQRWEAVCGLMFRRISDLSEANDGDVVNLVTVADLGGGGILADQMLPYRGGQMLRMRINRRIRWEATDGSMMGGTIDPIRTICHEIGHFIGLSHFPLSPPPELLEPTISHTIIRPQAVEIRIVAGWFGPPQEPTPPPVPPTDPTDRHRDYLDKIGTVIDDYRQGRATS